MSKRTGRKNQKGGVDFSGRNYYSVIGVSKDAKLSDITKAYRQKAMKLHPDKHKGEEKKYTELFQELEHAYSILKDSYLRAKYDMKGPTPKRPSPSKKSATPKRRRRSKKSPEFKEATGPKVPVTKLDAMVHANGYYTSGVRLENFAKPHKKIINELYDKSFASLSKTSLATGEKWKIAAFFIMGSLVKYDFDHIVSDIKAWDVVEGVIKSEDLEKIRSMHKKILKKIKEITNFPQTRKDFHRYEKVNKRANMWGTPKGSPAKPTKKYTVKELRQICKAKGLKGYGKMLKAELLVYCLN